MDWSSCHSTHASSPAPMLTAMSATLNVGQRDVPMPTSMKSTTPKNERTRSIRLPVAPAHTSASAVARAASPARVDRYRRARITSATSVSAAKIQRDSDPRFSPNAAPGLYTSRSCTALPNTSCGIPRISARSAIAFVITSTTRTTSSTGQNIAALLRLRIFLALLALDAVARVRQRVEPLERDVVPAVVTLAERLRRPVEAAQRLVDVPEEAALLAREEECLLALHGIGALIRHVERVAAQIAVGLLRGRAERLPVTPQLLNGAPALLHQPLLEVLQHLLRHRLGLLRRVL